MRGKNLLGPWGEEKAAEYLRRKGYTVEAANYRCRLGEIDLIVRRAGVVAFVEVKLRADDRFAEAREFVDRRKQGRIRAAASPWRMRGEAWMRVRASDSVIWISSCSGINYSPSIAQGGKSRNATGSCGIVACKRRKKVGQ